MSSDRNRVCPVELANSLDGKIRSWLHDPRALLSPYLAPGITALDVGCGPGFFSIEMARLVGSGGRVIAADLQEGMLQKVRAKIKGSELEERITLVKCESDRINVPVPVDFILAFYMVHEVPDKESFFRQLHGVLKEKGRFLIVEPTLFHVSRKEFESTLQAAERNGFTRHPGPRVTFSHSAILEK